jgi:arylsulfatase A-like enzyme
MVVKNSANSFLMAAFGLALFIESGANYQIKNAPPNIIIILADDAGYSDFGFMGSSDIQTPNLDKLAKDGVLFTQHYVSASVCSPSRAGLLTGKYQQRFGHECNLEPEQPLAFDTAQVTIAEALKKRGYQTAIFGKWHLGDYAHHHPLNNGFDKFWGFISGGRSYFPNPNIDKEGSLGAILDNHTRVDFEGYLTDVLGDQAIEYIDKQQHNPFFIYLSFNAPHTPMHAKADVVKKFKGKTDRPVYAAMMWSMDEAIGKVIKKLKDKGVYDNTLIFFLSDNGGAHNNQSSVAPLKGWKGNEFEGGIRVPMIVSWPAKVKANKTYTGIASSLDIFSTALSAAGEREHVYSEDGKNLMPFLKSKRYSVNVHESLFWRKDQMAAARVGDYKLVRLQGGQSVLYNIKTDRVEISDLSAQDAVTLSVLNDKLNQWEVNLKQPVWIEPEDWNTVTRMIYEDLMNNKSIRAKAPEDLKNQ